MRYLYLLAAFIAALAYSGHTQNATLSVLTWIVAFAVLGRWWVQSKD